MSGEKSFRRGAPVYLEAAPGLQVECLVTNDSRVIGRTRRVQVVPLKGKGIAWVEITRLQPKGGERRGDH